MRPIGGWSQRTHCKYDHEFTPENTRYSKLGHRICRQCVRTRALRYLATPGGRAKQREAKLRRYDRLIEERRQRREEKSASANNPTNPPA